MASATAELVRGMLLMDGILSDILRFGVGCDGMQGGNMSSKRHPSSRCQAQPDTTASGASGTRWLQVSGLDQDKDVLAQCRVADSE